MMLSDELRTFLQERWIARVTTIGPDGYPHSVPIWYGMDGDNIVIVTGPESRKIRNIRLNPKGAVTIGGDPKDAHVAYEVGYLFQGEFTVEKDPGGAWLKRITYRYRDDHEAADRDIAEWGVHDVIRLHVHKVIKVM